MSNQNTGGANATLAALLSQVEALNKQAESHTEPGSIGGETEHPIKKVDDNAEDAHEGSRSSENSSDVKETQGPASVESATKPAGEQEANQARIGPLASKSTGKDPSVETGSAKGDKDDSSIGGKTDHPATTEDGEKFGSAYEQLAAFSKQAETLGKAILADIINDKGNPVKKAEETPAAANKEAPKPAEASQKAAEDNAAAARAGYDLAGVFAGFDNFSLQDKQACDMLVVNRIKRATESGVRKAEAALEMYRGFFANKQANDEEGESSAAEKKPEEEGKEEEGGEGGGGSPFAGAGGGGGGEGGGPPVGDESMPGEEDLLAMLSGGGAGGDPMGGAGGGAGGGVDPLASAAGGGPMGGAGGGDPLAALGGGGGDPMGGGAAGGAGGGLEGIDPMMLQQILQQLGIDPAMLAGKAAAKLAALRQKKANKRIPADVLARRKAAMTRFVQDLVRSA